MGLLNSRKIITLWGAIPLDVRMSTSRHESPLSGWSLEPVPGSTLRAFADSEFLRSVPHSGVEAFPGTDDFLESLPGPDVESFWGTDDLLESLPRSDLESFLVPDLSLDADFDFWVRKQD